MNDNETRPFLDPETNEPYKLCRECHGWGTVTSTYPGGLMSTEDCPRCAGSGEES